MFALAPTFMLILTWPDSTSSTARIAKAHGLPILAVEVTTICIVLVNRRFPPIAMRNLVALGALIAVMWTAAYFAPAQGRSYLWTSIWLIHLLFGYSAAATFGQDIAMRSMLIGFMIFIAALVIRALIEPVADWENNPPAFDHIRRFSYYGAAVAGLSIGLFAIQRHRRLAFAAAVIAFGLTFWSGARGAVIAIAFGAVVSIVLARRTRRRSVAILASASALLGLAIASALPVPVQSMGISRMGVSNATMDATSGRVELWLDVMEAISQRPVLGWGEAQTHVVSLPLAQPHNIVLQLLLAWGLVGTIAVAILAWFAARRAYRNVKSRPQLLPMAAATTVILAYSMVDGTLFHVHSVSIFAMCAGLLLRGPVHGASEWAENETRST